MTTLDIAALPEVIRAPRTDALYNAHAYLTKIPVAAITPFLEALTKPGELVVDPFAGSGMTGLAAVLSGRRAILSDLSRLGQHIASGYLTDVEASELRSAAARVLAAARRRLGDLYQTVGDADDGVEMVRTIWSFTYRCPGCGGELLYFDALDEEGRPPRCCPSCPEPFSRRRWHRLGDEPVRVVYRGPSGRLLERPLRGVDRRAIERTAADPRREQVPSRAIDAGREMFRRSALEKHGLTETGAFFSPRNGIALVELWRAIELEPSADIQQKLAFAFTAILLRASRRYQWGPKRPLNAQAQTYYIAPVHYEWNVFELFGRKVEAVLRADERLPRGEARVSVRYVTSSADQLAHLDDESVDLVFTDPPFGSSIFYSDMSLFHEAWLGTTTDPTREAVLHTTGRRRFGASRRYEQLLEGAFCEIFRVLQPGRALSIVFSSTKGELWELLLRALRNAGFGEPPVHIAILDKGQRSIKGLASGTQRVVTKDLVLTFLKPASAASARETGPEQVALAELLEPACAGLDADAARDPSAIYVALLREAIARRAAVTTLHFGALRDHLLAAGAVIDKKTGLLDEPFVVSRAKKTRGDE